MECYFITEGNLYCKSLSSWSLERNSEQNVWQTSLSWKLIWCNRYRKLLELHSSKHHWLVISQAFFLYIYSGFTSRHCMKSPLHRYLRPKLMKSQQSYTFFDLRYYFYSCENDASGRKFETWVSLIISLIM
jgi:hypothetical protein